MRQAGATAGEGPRAAGAGTSDAHAIAYRPDVDGLRAVAIAAVVVYHAFPRTLRGGFTGVDVFFVISGFLISGLIWRALDSGTFSFLDFYARRARRLFPALSIVLAACLVAGWWLLPADEYALLGRDTAAAAVYVSNFALWRGSGYFGPDASHRVLTHLWSLGVEEQFYLVYPLLLVVAHRRRAWTPLVLTTLFVASFAANVTRVAHHPAEAFYLLPARFWELLLGGAVAYAARTAGTGALRRGRRADGAAAAGAGLLALAFVGPSAASVFPGWWALAPTAGTALLIAAGPGSVLGRRVLGARPTVYVGRISYPLYLWHFPLLVLVRLSWGPLTTLETLGLVAAAVVLAATTYELIERPVRARVRARAARPLAALAATLVATGALGLMVDADGGVPGRLPLMLRQLTTYDAAEAAVSYREGTCFLDPDQSVADLRSWCVDRGTKPLVVLWGDSHAADLYPGLRKLAGDGTFRLAELTASSCPPIIRYSSSDRPYCHGFNRGVLAKVLRLHPARVVLSAAWENYTDADYEGLAGTAEALRAAHIPAVLVGPQPHWPDGLPTTLFEYARTHPDSPLPRRLPQGLGADVARLDRALAAEARSARLPYVSPLSLLCRRAGCLTLVGANLDTVTAWDSAHFTDAGSVYVAMALRRALLGRY